MRSCGTACCAHTLCFLFAWLAAAGHSRQSIWITTRTAKRVDCCHTARVGASRGKGFTLCIYCVGRGCGSSSELAFVSQPFSNRSSPLHHHACLHYAALTLHTPPSPPPPHTGRRRPRRDGHNEAVAVRRWRGQRQSTAPAAGLLFIIIHVQTRGSSNGGDDKGECLSLITP